MSYRKLNVNGQTFEYSVGRTHTKIRHVGAFKNEEIGAERQSGICHCGSRGCDYAVPFSLQVLPKDIANFIHGKKLRIEYK